jgi:hypothetical protein
MLTATKAKEIYEEARKTNTEYFQERAKTVIEMIEGKIEEAAKERKRGVAVDLSLRLGERYEIQRIMDLVLDECHKAGFSVFLNEFDHQQQQTFKLYGTISLYW